MNKAELEGGEIRIRFSYNEDIIADLKTVAGYKWNPKPKRYWSYPFTPWHCKQVQNFPWIESLDLEILEGAKRYDELQKLSTKTRARRKGKLYSFQGAAVEFLEKTEGRCLLADEMGLGKTIELLYWLNKRDDIIKVLVVAPANVIYKWGHEVLTWTDRMPQIVEGSKADLEEGCIHIMSYGIMTRKEEELSNYDLVVLDECHYVKGRKGKVKRVDAIYNIAASCKYLVGMSGTPFLNRPAELYNMLHLLRPEEWPYFWPFGNKYCGGQLHDFRAATNREELAERLSTVMIRRLKSEVLDQLPELTRTIVPMDISEMGEYKRLEKEVYEAIKSMDSHHKGYFVNALDKLSLLRRHIGDAKARASISWISNFMDTTDNKLVVYCHHHAVVDYLFKELYHYGITTITGKVRPKERADRITKFQRDNSPRIILITSAGGEGIDLFGVEGIDISTILFVERNWTPAREEQAEARLHRLGQSSAVQAVYLVARRTVDERINAMINNKREVLRDIIGVEDITASIVPGLLEEIGG